MKRKIIFAAVFIFVVLVIFKLTIWNDYQDFRRNNPKEIWLIVVKSQEWPSEFKEVLAVFNEDMGLMRRGYMSSGIGWGNAQLVVGRNEDLRFTYHGKENRKGAFHLYFTRDWLRLYGNDRLKVDNTTFTISKISFLPYLFNRSLIREAVDYDSPFVHHIY